VLRQQKLVRKYKKLSKLMKAHNTRYLDLKNNIIPGLEKSIDDNNEFILVSVSPFHLLVTLSVLCTVIRLLKFVAYNCCGLPY
jgi:hypothetical protein